MNRKNFTIYFDEAGRGPLAGPVFVGLVCPIKNLTKPDLSIFNDSKQLSAKQRNFCLNKINELQQKGDLTYSTARMTAYEIDKYGMTNSLHCAILRGMIQIFSKSFPQDFNFKANIPTPLSTNNKIQISYSAILSAFLKLEAKGIHIQLIMDGNSNFGLKKSFPFREFKTIISGDVSVKEISMASIIAKVSRDNIMENLPKKYDKYKFGKHKGYGTKEHKKLIEEFGPSNIHRKLFLKKLFPLHKIEKSLPTKF